MAKCFRRILGCAEPVVSPFLEKFIFQLASTTEAVADLQVAVPGASLEQNQEIAEVLKDELNAGVKLDDVLHAAKTMKQELVSKLKGVGGKDIPDLS